MLITKLFQIQWQNIYSKGWTINGFPTLRNANRNFPKPQEKPTKNGNKVCLNLFPTKYIYSYFAYYIYIATLYIFHAYIT